MEDFKGPSEAPIAEVYWKAVLNHDPSFDGVFYYAVHSTKIYSRPSCPSRRPVRENTTFFSDTVQARQSGFRPCKRCQPDTVNFGVHAVAKVKHLLETLEPEPTLGDLACRVHLSPFYLQRLFKRVTGFSPKQYAIQHRLKRFKVHVRSGLDVTEATFESGYGSSRALYDQSKPLGMTPKSYLKGGMGEHIDYAVAASPVGDILVAMTHKGLCAVHIGAYQSLIGKLHQEFPNATLELNEIKVKPYLEAVLSYLEEPKSPFALALDIHPTDFQRCVWDELLRIPYGETRSYQEIAEAIGKPQAVRAVARACAANPVALVIPCHRVIGKSGELSGYRWGVRHKRMLLEKERDSH